MRIIGGEFRSRKLKSPSSGLTRPTKDRVREAVFSMIAGRICNSRVLDLFAGSGAYGLEALSRGAASCVFVDNDMECEGVMSENIEKLKISEKAKVMRKDAGKYIEELGKNGEKFDIIFIDPPYSLGASRNILIMIERYDILSDSGLLIAEHSSKESIPEGQGDVSIYKQKSYGITSISIFIKK